MGQYFNAVNLDKQEFVSPHDYDGGAKLMEHSWLYNPMVNAVVIALSPYGAWFKDHIVWAGDYMDEGLFLEWIKGKSEKDLTLYNCCRDSGKKPAPCSRVRKQLEDGPVPEYIVNHDRMEYVLLTGLPEEDLDDPGWNIHPLPLLTCSGNGRGGGDFSGDNAFVGVWAGHSLSAECTIPDGYKQILPDFSERSK